MSQQLVTSRIENVCDLSPLQEGMLFHGLESPGGGAYVVQQVFLAGDGDGPFGVEAVGAALRGLAVKHAILRTAFVSEGLERPRQVVLRERETGFGVVDLRRAGRETAEAIDRFLAEDVERGFDLARDPLLRVTAIRTIESDAEVLRLVWTYHHIILDGWSLSTLFSDFLRYHRAVAGGADPSAVLAMAAGERGQAPEYASFVRHLAARPVEAFEKYWSGLLEGCDGSAAVTGASAEIPGTAGAGRIVSSTGTGVARRLTEVFASRGVTLSHVAEAAWGVVLSRATGSPDVVFGKVVSGRDVPLPGIDKTVGLFINTIPVRVRVTGEAGVRDLVGEVRDQAIASAEHDHGSLARMQALAGVDGLVSTLFAFENFQVDESVLDGAGLAFERSREETDYPLTMTVQRTGDDLTFVVLYDRGVLTPEDAERITGRLSAVLEEFADDPEAAVGKVSSLLPGEREAVLGGAGGVGSGYPRDGSIGEVFASVAARHGDRIALVCGEERVTYRELNARAERVAGALAGAGIGVGHLVGVAGEPSADLFAGLLGIVLSGAGYVPLDIAAPVARGSVVAEDAGVSVVVSAGARGASFAREIAPSARIVEVENAAGHPAAEVAGRPAGGDAAYVMFTSGTTGRPKGSVIPQRAVLRLVCGNSSLPLSAADVLVQTGSLAFDASTFEIWGMWLNGGTLVVPDREDLLDPHRLGGLIRRSGATVMWLTVSLFNQIAVTDTSAFAGLDRLLVGGEAVSADHVHLVYDNVPGITLVNGYGPTENTTFTATHPISRTRTRTVPIGRPIAGTSALVLDGTRLCGVGEVGELCAGGDGLSTGYLGLPELTAARFVPDPFGDGRLYRTGDRVRLLADGTIEYLGRLDDEQVKVRGYRVELPDIEAALRDHPAVRDAVVLAHRDPDGTTALAGYAVAEEGGLDPAELRAFLGTRLPAYMVPAHLLGVAAIPLTRNGKIDRAALPAPALPKTASAVEPADEVEAAVCEAFATVLGLDAVGVLDSFFELGGDSIKAIRVVSRIRAAGFEVKVGDVMAGLTARGVAARVTRETASAFEQGSVSGPVGGVWPIVEEFFAWDLAVPAHFNQEVLVDVGFAAAGQVRAALDAIWAHHDAFRAVVAEGRLTILGVDDVRYGFEHHTVSDAGEVEAATVEAAERLHASMDLGAGPLLRAALVTGPAGSRLFLVAHHLVVDAVSWQVVVEDLLTGIRRARNERAIVLPDKTASLRQWSGAMADLAATLVPEEREYWDRVDREASAALLRVAGEDGDGVDSREVVLDAAATADLGRAAGYRASMEDVVLAALAMGVADLSGQKRVAVRLERHGRGGHPSLPAVDRTVGWFTGMFPVVLDCLTDPGEAIVAAKETLRAVPYGGIGYGLRPGGFGRIDASVTLNYLGEQDATAADGFGDVVFGRTGTPSHPANRHLAGVGVNVLIREGRLVATITSDARTLDGTELARLAEGFRRGLTAIAAEAGRPRRKTPSDYAVVLPLSRDDQRRIESLYPHHTDIADLTPLQEGMLFHGLEDPASGAYVVQQVFRAADEDGAAFGVDAVETALRALAARHGVLRTAFASAGLERPRQVVLRDRGIGYAVADLRDQGPEALDRLLAEDVERGFDLARDPLLRVTAIRTTEDERDVLRLVWTYHHIILDGWSLSTLFGDFLRYHRAVAEGADTSAVLAGAGAERGESAAFTAYVRHVAERGTAAFDRHWSQLLDGYDTEAVLATASAEGTAGASGVGRVTVTSTGDLASRLSDLFAPRGATLSHVTEAAWGLVLSRAVGEPDVVFGKVVSGRDAPLPGIDKTVGLFINTIPVRVQIPADGTVAELVEAVRDQAIASAGHDHGSLARIQASVPVERLVGTLFAFENYHVEAGTIHGGGLAYERGREEETNYPFNLVVQRDGGELEFTALYDRAELTESDVDRLLARVLLVLGRIAEDTRAPLREVATVSPAEKRTVVEEFNRTLLPYPAEMTAVSAFLDGVREHPERVALVWGERSMTYRDVADAAAGVARALVAGGAARGAAVGVLGERSTHVIVGILGVMLAGCHFIPLDVTSPPARIAQIVADSGMAALATYGPRAAETVAALGGTLASTAVHDLAAVGESTWDELEFADRLPSPADPAYCIYTSGTTGVPKGVLLVHKGLVNLRAHLRDAYAVTSADRVLQFSNLTFDASVWEIALSLLNGAALVIVDQETVYDAGRLVAESRRRGVTLGLLPPQYYLLCEGLPLRIVTTGGGASSLAVVEKARREAVGYVNAYGPTETTVLTTGWPDDGSPITDPARIPIGRPVANTQVHILDAARLCGIGEPGELCAAGDGLSTGYVGLSELTAERFVPNPYGEGRLYRTGDRARLLSDGTVQYLGRVDDQQVKVRGFRIEIGDVESAVRAHPAVRDAAVVAHEERDGSTALAAYVTPAGSDGVDVGGLRSFLAERLPAYMIPARIAEIPAIPLTRHGKLDRAALPEPVTAASADRVEAADELEAAIAAIWAEVLGHAHFGTTENFFELGGNSLTIVQVHGRLGKDHPGMLSVGDLFAMPTVRSLAAGIRARRSARVTLTRAALRRPATAKPQSGAVAYPQVWRNQLAAEAAYALTLALAASCEQPPAELLVWHQGGLTVLDVPADGEHTDRLARLRRAVPESVPLTEDRRVRVSGTGALVLLKLPGAARVANPVLRDVDVTVELASAADRVTARSSVTGRGVDRMAAAQLFQRFAVLFGRLLSAAESGS
ncbi:amino acid adenylation domain-containing protein [Phytomonospora sp. NPDC050363]|uniref:amino acid adenylation domain-containing protein n=1 Tax=Phytomonospora sp. NPDC050363 TaxID=3155642 RepID=UPI0033FE8671